MIGSILEEYEEDMNGNTNNKKVHKGQFVVPNSSRRGMLFSYVSISNILFSSPLPCILSRLLSDQKRVP